MSLGVWYCKKCKQALYPKVCHQCGAEKPTGPKKHIFRIPCSWEVYGLMWIGADDLEEALAIAELDALPSGEYVDGSFVIDRDVLDVYLDEDGLLDLKNDEETIE